MAHNGLQAYTCFVAMPILRKFETEVNTFLFMCMNSRDVIIFYLELWKTRSVFPIPLEFEISKFACTSIVVNLVFSGVLQGAGGRHV